MGLDYGFVLTLKKGKLKNFFTDITLNHSNGLCKTVLSKTQHYEVIDVKKIDPEDFFYQKGFALSLQFKVDRDIIRYLQTNQTDKLNENKKHVFIGLIYVHITQNTCVKNYADITFMAATSDMSLAFATSDNIRSFFINISRQYDAELLFLDTEGQCTVLWYNKKEYYKCIDNIYAKNFIRLFFLQNELEAGNNKINF